MFHIHIPVNGLLILTVRIISTGQVHHRLQDRARDPEQNARQVPPNLRNIKLLRSLIDLRIIINLGIINNSRVTNNLFRFPQILYHLPTLGVVIKIFWGPRVHHHLSVTNINTNMPKLLRILTHPVHRVHLINPINSSSLHICQGTNLEETTIGVTEPAQAVVQVIVLHQVLIIRVPRLPYLHSQTLILYILHTITVIPVEAVVEAVVVVVVKRW